MTRTIDFQALLATGLLPLLISATGPARAQAPTAFQGGGAVEMMAQAGQPPLLPATPTQPAGPTGITPTTPPADSFGGDLASRSNLFGSPWGIRSTLAAHGVGLALSEISEVLGNASGGLHRGAIYEGMLAATLTVDTDKLIGLPGGNVNITAYQIHGRGLSFNNLGNLSTASSIEADRSLRLFEAWYEQSLLGDTVMLRIGQQSADQEFLISQYGSLFLNSQFGWPTISGVDLPSGGNAFPLGTPGVRLKLQPTAALTGLFAVYNGDPAGKGTGDPQLRDAGGTTFDLDDGVFAIGELQYAVNHDDKAPGLPGIYRIGAYYNSNGFADQALDNTRRSLADPDSNGNAVLHHGTWAVYAVMDQLLWHHGDSRDKGIGLFGRIVGTRGDRNLVSLYAEGGLSWKGLIPSRGDDTVGIGVGYSAISGRARQLDRDTASFSGTNYPVRDGETDIELTYQAAVLPWLVLQPDAQYVIHPSGGVPRSDASNRVIRDEAVFGLRATVTF